MKIFIKISLVCFFLGIVSPAFGQFSLNGFSLSWQGSLIMVGGRTNITNIGGGVKLEYAVEENKVLYGGYNHYLPSDHPTFVYGYPSNNEISQKEIRIKAIEQISLQQFVIGGKYYFLGHYEDPNGLYGLVEMGYLRAPTKTYYSKYDRENYRPMHQEGFSTSYSSYNINIGLGGEVDLLFGYLFAEAKFNLPANRVGDQFVTPEIPASVSLNGGLRFPLYFF